MICTAPAHLVEVSCSQLPGLGCKVDVVAVMDLGQVVEAVALCVCSTGTGDVRPS